MAEPLIINNFDAGIGDSAHKGFGLMRNVDIEAFPGAAKVQKAPSSLFVTAFAGTFTAADTDIFTASGFNVPATGTAVVLTTTGTLPAGLSLSTTYFVINIDSSTGKLATTVANADAGTAVNITDTGSGTHTMTSRNPGTVNHITYNALIDMRFYFDSNGRVWYGNSNPLRLLDGNTLTASSGKGMVTFTDGNATIASRKTYLFVFRNGNIDVCDVSTEALREAGASSWTNGWQPLPITSSNSRHAILGQDNIIYYCNDSLIGSIKEATAPFVPGTASSYTFNNAALDLYKESAASWLEEIGTKLLIADENSNKIFPWDRVSDSFDLPLLCPEQEIYRMKNIGNLVYILAGTMGNIYTTQGTYIKHFKKLPDQVVNNSGTLQSNIITWGGIDSVRGALLFGVGALTTANSGVYMLYPDGRLLIDQQPIGGAGNATAILAINNFYEFGYASGADTHSTSRYSALEAVIQSMWYRVATKTEKGTYSKLEVVTAKPATTGAQIRIGYRTNTSASFTTLATYTADSSAVVYQTDNIGLIDIENIQVQAEFDDDVELVEIRLLP